MPVNSKSMGHGKNRLLKGNNDATFKDVAISSECSCLKLIVTGDDINVRVLPTSDPGEMGRVYIDGAPSAGNPKALKISGG